jgi:translation initiation factor 4G
LQEKTSTAYSSPGPTGFVAEPTSKVPDPAASAVPPAKKPRAPTPRLNLDDLQRKKVSLLEEYFSIWLLDEALQCVEELKAPTYYPEFVKEAIYLGLDKSPPCVELVTKLLEYLLDKKVLTPRDIGTGCLLYGSMLDDVGINLPKAPNNFGEIIGKLVLAGGLDFKVVNEILKKVEDDQFQKELVEAAIRVVSSTPSGQGVLDS